MADGRQKRQDLLNGAKKALEGRPKPEECMVTVRAVDLLAALGESPSPATGATEGSKATDR